MSTKPTSTGADGVLTSITRKTRLPVARDVGVAARDRDAAGAVRGVDEATSTGADGVLTSITRRPASIPSAT